MRRWKRGMTRKKKGKKLSCFLACSNAWQRASPCTESDRGHSLIRQAHQPANRRRCRINMGLAIIDAEVVDGTILSSTPKPGFKQRRLRRNMPPTRVLARPARRLLCAKSISPSLSRSISSTPFKCQSPPNTTESSSERPKKLKPLTKEQCDFLASAVR